jgi:hypothetical protein
MSVDDGLGIDHYVDMLRVDYFTDLMIIAHY